MANREVQLTLDEAVNEVLGLLSGLELRYEPELDRYRAVTRALNRALRANALEHDWSYYASLEELGTAVAGQREVQLRSSVRPRILHDDAVLLCLNDEPVVWAYFLPRDALEKYITRGDLRCAVTKQSLRFSRPFTTSEDGLTIKVPVMREPKIFRLPEQPEDPQQPLVEVDQAIRDQLVDFDYPDVVVVRAAYYYAQTDPVLQPRVQTLEQDYKTLMYQLIERDEKHSDAPYQNEYFLPIINDIAGPSLAYHQHPHADERRLH